MSRRINLASKRAGAAVIVLAGLTAVLTAGLAIAKAGHKTIRTAHNAKLGETIVVGASGHTVYELSPETTRHLLCTSADCLRFWPPVKVRSGKAKLSKAKSVRGKLGIIHRDGFFQVTLSGRPLYYFSADSASGQANGQGLMTFGGTWHVVRAGGASSPAAGTTTTQTTTTTPSPYGY